MRTLLIGIGFYTLLLSSYVDALELTEYSEVFSQNSDPLGKNGDYHYTLFYFSIYFEK